MKRNEIKKIVKANIPDTCKELNFYENDLMKNVLEFDFMDKHDRYWNVYINENENNETFVKVFIPSKRLKKEEKEVLKTFFDKIYEISPALCVFSIEKTGEIPCYYETRKKFENEPTYRWRNIYAAPSMQEIINGEREIDDCVLFPDIPNKL